MLAFLRGTILFVRDSSLVVDVHDVGYAVAISGSLLMTKKAGDSVELFLHQHIREDGNDLYGFETQNDLTLFERLISVSGVGPKTALNALSTASSDGIKSAIARGDAGLLRTISGIGPKAAERIIIDLKGVYATEGVQGNAGADRELIEALIGLGYAARDAAETVRVLPQEETRMEERLKAALRMLGGTR